MNYTAGVYTTSGTLALTGLATAHYVVAAMALIALGYTLFRMSYLARRATSR